MYQPHSQELVIPNLIPHGTVVQCDFRGCERIRHFGEQTKLQYLTRWVVSEGPHRGAILTRNWWTTEKGIGYLQNDCNLLDLGHAEELCMGYPHPITVEGTVSVNSSSGEQRNELARIARRIAVPSPKPTEPQSYHYSSDPELLQEAF